LQILSEKSALEKKLFNMTSELMGLNKSFCSEKSSLELTISKRTLELHVLNQSLSLELHTLNQTLADFRNTTRTGNYPAMATAREKEFEMLALNLNETCIAHEKDKIQLTEKLERDKQQLAEQLRAESLANETKLLQESIANETRRLKEIESLNASYSRENELLLNTSKSVNETLKKLMEHHLNESLQQEMAGNLFVYSFAAV